MVRLATLTSVLFLAITTAVFFDAVSHAHEHGSDDASQHYHGTITMEEQHKAVAAIWKQWTDAKTQCSNGDLKMLKKTVDVMLESSSILPQFRPHKNGDKMDEFKGEYTLFRERLKSLKDIIDAGNIAGVNKAMDSVEEACDRCHSKFKL